MKINDIYIEQTNRFCDANCKISAEDILAKAKLKQDSNDIENISATDAESKSNIKEFKTTKNHAKHRQSVFRLSPVVAVCICFVLLAGTGILAFGGNGGYLLANTGATMLSLDERKMEIFLLKNWNDYTSSSLVQQGYFYEIGHFMEDNDYKAELIAVTGDVNDPRLLVDFYIKDEKVAAENERIFLNVYILGKEAYFQDRSTYSACGAYGVKDDEVNNLYHVNIECPPAWIATGEEVVIAVSTVYTDLAPDETEDLSYWSFVSEDMAELGIAPNFTINEMNFYYSTTIPKETFAHVTTRRYHNVVFNNGKYDYKLDKVEYGHYNLNMTFKFEYEDGTASDYANNKASVEERLFLNWKNLATEMTLIVDGETYASEERNIGLINWDFEGNYGPPNYCYARIVFPDVDYHNAESIILQVGDISYDLKQSN